MIGSTRNLRVWAYPAPADLRKGYDGLYGLVVSELGRDPLSGDCFLFTNRVRTRAKVLVWDGTGLWVMTKRLEQGTFAWPKGVEVENGRLSLRPEALALLLDGVDLRGGSLRPWYQR